MNLLFLGALLFLPRGREWVMKLLGAWNLAAFFWVSVPSRSGVAGTRG